MEETQADSEQLASDVGSVWRGVGTSLIMITAAQLVLGFGSPLVTNVLSEQFGISDKYNTFTLVIFLSVGWTQLLYLVPYAMSLSKRGLSKTRDGVAFVGAVLFLLTSLCNGIMLPSL